MAFQYLKERTVSKILARKQKKKKRKKKEGRFRLDIRKKSFL